MGYCRFRNTLTDLADCADHLDHPLDDPDEERARKRLVLLCQQIAQDYGDES
jgi:hypothetical protein